MRSLIKHHPLPFFSLLQKLYHQQQDNTHETSFQCHNKSTHTPSSTPAGQDEIPPLRCQECSCSSLQHVFPQRFWAVHHLSLASVTTFSEQLWQATVPWGFGVCIKSAFLKLKWNNPFNLYQGNGIPHSLQYLAAVECLCFSCLAALCHCSSGKVLEVSWGRLWK